MRRTVLYSSPSAQRPAVPVAPKAPTRDDGPARRSSAPDPANGGSSARPPGRLRRLWRHPRRGPLVSGTLFGALLATAVWLAAAPPVARSLTQEDIDAAVLHTLNTKRLPSKEAKAAAAIAPSVVRVIALGEPDAKGQQEELGTGSGVVLVEDGTILTNLHVAAQAPRLKVVFHDGHVSDARMTGSQPENDLAVIRASSLPDDLKPATMRSTADLQPGDMVVATGFPFGIGPSVSAGVVSGLKREFRSPAGEKVLTNLIQFDAAANPGSSGGPLVTEDGEVVGIVTAILNPSKQGVFVGIGFAVPIENAAGAVGLSPF
ncbi:S1C family serine protease [Aquabacterium sp. J223]|uniref:S1C family serine protease n=1 Tax=Aquabacterium sp. J223 TaxID=2898431 RepID=UPI0021ADE651|nr:S1C family serine protease [Aquabacterium sp. J223]UUX95773.1 S1C family serine protease [Aquabacterium sp. J223]